MDKKSENGYPRSGGESGGGGQRKQLPYSVETPYGFHLDLDFLKYVDDIEKGNTIKRVHIQRKARGPPKFSTLPRNFSLLGHGARPAPKDTWSSTLGPKPRGRITDVQQILDFRPSDGGTSGIHSQNSRVQGSSFASARPREEAGAGPWVLGEQPLGRPNLLRTSSMPVTIPHRKASESGDERTENVSSENVVRAVPQDRSGLHQQITAALKRVRELEDMVRTIPELKSQICSLRVEREQLILRLQVQTKLQPPAHPQSDSPSPAPSTDPGPASQPPGAEAAVDPGRAESTVSEAETQQESLKSTAQEEEPDRLLAAPEPERQIQTAEGPDRQTAFLNPLVHAEERPTEQPENVATPNEPEPLDSRVFVQVTEGVSVSGEEHHLSVEQLQAKLVALEAKLSQASEDLERTNSLLKQQVEENMMKEERILQLSVGGTGGAEEVFRQRQTSRRTSVDRQTETEGVGSASQETETERTDMVEQGTDTERIVICLTGEGAGGVEQGTETERFDTQDQVTETEIVIVCPVRPRANSVDRGTETERVDTVDQVTETLPGDSLDQVTETQTVVSVDQSTETAPVRPVRPARHRANSVDRETETQTVDTVNQVTVTETQTGVRVDQVTETQTQTAPVGPVRPARHRANSVDRGTETERVGTVDQVTETVVAQSTYQQTETEGERVETTNNHHREIEIESAAIVSAAIESAVTEIVEAERVVSRSLVKEGEITESAVRFVVIESVGKENGVTVNVVPENVVPENVVPENVVTENVVPENVVTENVVTGSMVKRQVVVVEETVVEQITLTESVVTQSMTTESTVVESAATENLATESEVVKTTVTESTVTGSAVIESPAPESPEVAPTPSSSQTQMGQKESEQAQPQSQDSRQGSNPALGQVVTRLTGLINEQWAQLGSSQDKPDKQETTSPSAQKPAEGQGAPAAGKPLAGKATGKSGLSKMSSIQSQLVSSLSALSAFYSPGQKAAASKQQGLKSIMKKNDAADKQGNRGGAKKSLKFVGVNGGYETTSSEEESSEEEKGEVEEEVDSSEPEEEREKEEEVDSSEPEEEREKEEGGGAAQGQGEATATEDEPQGAGAQAGETEVHEDSQDPENSQALLEEQLAASSGETIDKGFMEACDYIEGRMAEVVAPDKEMRHVLMVLYQEWFRVSSQKDSLADTVTLYLREVGIATPTLLRYIVNLADGNGNTALHYSVSHSNFPVVKLLLDTGLCEVDILNKAGYTAVMLASLTAADGSEDMEVALQLLRQGDVNARASQAGQTALMLSVSHGRTAMVRLLLSCQADLNIQDRDGSTALMCACEHGHTEIARVLLESGHCDTSLTDKNGQRALSVAVVSSHAEIVDLLKSHSDSTTTQASNPSTTTSATIITTTTASLL
uniref:KN motif and ankyrin repeat domain-containing protein 4-like n=1 Tax=Oncorhynchus gorbuscha TaxID=8017 RepID=UPI001EAF22B1|nr:KN motif and ankyrin repeat domain-containing protein 4-like [Oncorhynchus gorbuscha]XP_046209339.1 KN motif and ankyrin repeat domain-containing protein 4-like [Oncorhynchus gorbuscha]XP_046209340.1 KN motif and ankyrin repeat domain-containing protein 4-like [Oncorhynchus gorbuscha]XP_046209341.1 KN motif and ankyrin repeat domain-containing protein 4-like [Oncorhynchus gorbuscha]